MQRSLLKRLWVRFGRGVAIAALVLIFAMNSKAQHAVVSLWPSSFLVWLKVIAYGIVPMGLAIFGAIYAAEAMPSPKAKRMARTLFIASGLVGVLMICYIETKSESEHRAEVGDVKKQMATLGDQETLILKHLVTTPDAGTREISRRQDILTLLRHQWILSHKNVSSGLLAGTELPPSSWINERLKQLGEKWSVGKEPWATPVQSVNSPDPYAGIPNATIAQYLNKEADELEGIGTQCIKDEIAALEAKRQGHAIVPGVQGSQIKFWMEFNTHMEAITKLHDSVVYRLGPIATESFEKEYRELQEDVQMAQGDPQDESSSICQNFGVIGIRPSRSMAHQFGIEMPGWPNAMREAADELISRSQKPEP